MVPLVDSSSNLKLVGGRKVGWRDVGRRHRVAVDGHHKAKYSFREIKRQLIMQITVFIDHGGARCIHARESMESVSTSEPLLRHFRYAVPRLPKLPSAEHLRHLMPVIFPSTPIPRAPELMIFSIM